ncbi:hypothetical protein [Leifsonia sp. NCR5]|uniref:ParB family protein n=1 Tax=Leifsonia sp. NCR5 TaxID=1978342 RepID=UPI00117AD374|nr:hypothetical protein [Leifsonia sp. NCR5]
MSTTASSGPGVPVMADDDERNSVSFYLRSSVRQRSRAAFEATKHHESDRSWSDLMEKALVAELERREALYNDGHPYLGGPERLTPGRRPRSEIASAGEQGEAAAPRG